MCVSNPKQNTICFSSIKLARRKRTSLKRSILINLILPSPRTQWNTLKGYEVWERRSARDRIVSIISYMCYKSQKNPKILLQGASTQTKCMMALSLREPRLLAQVDAMLLQMMPKLEILLDKGNATFNNNNKRKTFRLSNFPRAAIFDFMTSLRCPIVSNKRTSAFQQ